MTYVAPTTVVAGDTYSAAQHNVIVNDVIDHESRIVAVSSSVSAVSASVSAVSASVSAISADVTAIELWAVSGGGMSLIDHQTFSATGTTTYTMPANAKLVYLEAIGTGSGGSSGTRHASTSYGGSGGAGGAFYQSLQPASVFSSPISVTIGAGGTGGAGYTGSTIDTFNTGNPGGNSSFGHLNFLGARRGGTGSGGG